MKKSYYVSEVEDKMLIKVVKLNKNLNIMIDSREVRASIRDYLDIEKIHVQTVLVNEKVKIFNFSLKKFTLFEVDIQLYMS